MHHPFNLNLLNLPFKLKASDLEFEEPLSEQESAQIAGGVDATTLAIGEEGGRGYRPPKHRPPKWPIPSPIDPVDPPVTTKALGEEGGYTTMALGEEGGEPVEVTTLALGEEGGTWIE
jgi:hypothetical protein